MRLNVSAVGHAAEVGGPRRTYVTAFSPPLLPFRKKRVTGAQPAPTAG